jgi:isopenicillin-N N-acyltransferase-like protein
MVRKIICSGSPYEVGLAHGTAAKEQILSSISFYAGLFQTTAQMQWEDVLKTASEFQATIQTKWPAYLEEMAGIAAGAGVQLADIVALNVRTEITFGLFTEGCTTLAWKTSDTCFMGQNWDWMEAQKKNVVLLHIKQPDKPDIKLITEAGLIGKIGINSAGVGLCVNAIRVAGNDPTKLPAHLAWRMALESWSRAEAVAKLTKFGIASSCHTLIADKTGPESIEWTHLGFRDVSMNDRGQISHSNHLLLDQPGVIDTNWLPDSSLRVKRMEELSSQIQAPSIASIQPLFADEQGFPAAICRAEKDTSTAATLFNIVMDLGQKVGYVRMGRPSEPEEAFTLEF